VFHWTGWYDNFLRASLEGWVGVQERNIYETVRQNQWLTISPADHELTTEKTGRAGRLNLGRQGITNDRVCRFFDHWLRGAADTFGTTPRVCVYVLGADRWREAAEWPLPGTRFTEFYLRGGGGLSRCPPAAESPDMFDYDPAASADYWVGKDAWAAARTLVDRRRMAARADVLGFVTAPLAEPLEVVGPLAATLFVSTSAPGDVHEVHIDMAATGYEFASGHCVGVEVSSSAFDRWDRNPNTGNAFGTDTAADLRVAHQTVYHDGERPSRIVLPLAPPC